MLTKLLIRPGVSSADSDGTLPSLTTCGVKAVLP